MMVDPKPPPQLGALAMTPGRRSLTGTPWSTRHLRRTPLLLALCASALLAACGGDDDGTPSDTTPPTVAITDSVSATTATGPVTFTFTFSEDVGTSFATADVTATGGTKAALVKVSATSYTLVVTPTASAAGTIDVSVAAGAFSDLAGNASTAAASASQAYDTRLPDTTPPTVAITDSVSGATATGDVTFTFTFSEDVGTSFITDDVTVTGGTKGAFAKSSATVYTLVVAPAASATGTINVNVAVGAFSDVAGNASTAAASGSQDYDTRPPTSGGAVFTDDYAAGVSFVAFGGSTNAVTVDTTGPHSGTAALKIAVPAGGYTGGALAASAPKDLSTYNALTFWIKGSKAATLNVSGIGNDGLGGVKYSAESLQIPVTTTWTQFTIPIPVPAKATAVVGLFHFAEGAEEGAYDIFLDDIQYESLSAAAVGAADSASVGWSAVNLAVGATFQLNYAPNAVVWGAPLTTNGGILTNVGFVYYTLTSSDPTKATVDDGGLVTGVAGGTSQLSAKLGALDVPGVAPVTVTAPLGVPTTAAPTPPARAPADYVSMFSGAYTNVAVDTWRTGWSGCCNTLTDPFDIAGDAAKKYELFHFVGIEFLGANVIDASAMTTMHMDVWTPNGTEFQIRLVNNVGASQTESTVTYNAGSSPAITTGSWISLEIPMSAFSGLSARNQLGQMLLLVPGGSNAVFYVDNIYFHK